MSIAQTKTIATHPSPTKSAGQIFCEQFGSALYHARKSANVTQRDLAQSLGRTQQAVAYWESGDKLPRLAALEALIGHFGLFWVGNVEFPEDADLSPEDDDFSNERKVFAFVDHLRAIEAARQAQQAEIPNASILPKAPEKTPPMRAGVPGHIALRKALLNMQYMAAALRMHDEQPGSVKSSESLENLARLADEAQEHIQEVLESSMNKERVR